MRILHVISSAGLYGAEAVILSLSAEFSRLGHQSEIATFDNIHLPNRQLSEAAERAGIHVHRLPCNGPIDSSAVQRLRSLIRSGDYDICHSHGFKSDVYLYMAGRKCSQILVATCHTWYDNDLPVTLYGILDRFILRSFDRVVSVSAAVTRRLTSAGVRATKITFISNGVDVSRFRNITPSLREELGLSAEDILVGTVGRLSQEKGLQYLLTAAETLIAQDSHLRFVIVGEGPDRKKLEALALELKVDSAIRFLGRRSDMPEVFAALDILVQPSLNEGLPITLLEALASGCAVVATAVGAVPSLIENGIHGVLVPPANANLLTQAISLLANDAQLRSRLAVAGRARIVDKFSSARMAEAYLDVYRQALDGKYGALSTPA